MTPHQLAWLTAIYLAIPLLGTLAVAVVTAWWIENGFFDRPMHDRRTMAVKR